MIVKISEGVTSPTALSVEEWSNNSADEAHDSNDADKRDVPTPKKTPSSPAQFSYAPEDMLCDMPDWQFFTGSFQSDVREDLLVSSKAWTDRSAEMSANAVDHTRLVNHDSVAHARDQALKVFDAVGVPNLGQRAAQTPTARPPDHERQNLFAKKVAASVRRRAAIHPQKGAGKLMAAKAAVLSRLESLAAGKNKFEEERADLAALAAGFSNVARRCRFNRPDAETGPSMNGSMFRAGPKLPRTKIQAKRCQAALCSFQDLVNVENNPTPLSEALQRMESVAKGRNFVWKKVDNCGNRYGGAVDMTYELILWYENVGRDAKTHTTVSISFLQRQGVAYVYQPVVPVVSLMISPGTSMRPMFHKDPRSFHTFKLAWKPFLDFGVSDYRVVVGEQLERWTTRCKQVIERPLNATYWLMVMVGSYYREILVQRRVVRAITDPAETTPVICIDSFVALSTLLFSPERQVLFAGIDPTPSYLQWLQYIGNQNSDQKGVNRSAPSSTGASASPATVFSSNEFLDVSVIVVYYGRIQQKVKESAPLSWVANPDLIRWYTKKYMEDNRCESQLEDAVRLYTKSCAIGKGTKDADAHEWHCWNGLIVCDIGVPMPHTSATFLSPFIVTKPVALHCRVHGPDAKRNDSEALGETMQGFADDDVKSDSGISASSDFSELRHACARAPSESARSHAHTDPEERVDEDNLEKLCVCSRYIPPPKSQGPKKKRRPQANAPPNAKQVVGDESEEIFACLGEYDLIHAFSAVLAGGLNVAKHFVRLHFSIDSKAYENLPVPWNTTWSDSVIPWYRDFHCPDVFGRSRYTLVLERVVHGLLGDGFTSGLPVDALDCLRIGGQEALFPDGNEDKPMSSHARARRGSLYTERQSLHVPSTNRYQKGVIGDIALWTELHECESLYNHRGHFETFTQWCHSAHLVPFLQRCYRRCGIAGLMPGAQSGGHRRGADPSHPLVLPTMSDFHYGHCYPIHRVMQYYYGGVDHVMCSVEDPQTVESERSLLGLPACQNRLPEQCWFEPVPAAVEVHVAQQNAAAGKRALTDQFLQRLTEALDNSRPPSPPHQTDLSPRRGSATGAQGHRESQTRLLQAKLTSAARQVVKVTRQPKPGNIQNNRVFSRLGMLVPSDPFFWFCSQNLTQFTYPANSFPKHLLDDPENVQFRYADFVSRSGTPVAVERPAETDGEVPPDHPSIIGNRIPDRARPQAIPPSINVCQPTDLGASRRQRWEVQLSFVDEDKLILGDSCWWPGAVGHRFCYEARSDHPDRFANLGVVPLAYLLYIEHVAVPNKEKSVRTEAGESQDRGGRQTSFLDPSESSGEDGSESQQDGEEPQITTHPRRKLGLSGGNAVAGAIEGTGSSVGESCIEVMLPPLLSMRAQTAA